MKTTIEAPPALSLATARTTTTPQSTEDVITAAERCGLLHQAIEHGVEQIAHYYVEMFTLLTEAKREARRTLGTGGWLRWLADNKTVLGFGERQAQRYLRETPDLRKADLEANRQAVAKHRAKKKTEEKVEPEDILTAAEASRATTLAKNAEGPRYSKTGVVQPTDDNEMRAAQEARREEAQALILDGYETRKSKNGDSARLRLVRDELLRLSKGVA
jgi:hypothetical protein